MQSDLLALLLSASLGALLGIERQWEEQQRAGDKEVAAGLRTFVLWALLGAGSALMARTAPGFFSVGFIGLVLLMISRALRDPENAPGFTTLGAGLLTYLCGGLVVAGYRLEATVLAVLAAVLLASKERIHRWSERITSQDVESAIVFLAITGIILPLAPNHNYGPYGAFNPFQIWLMVVMVTGLGFFGYIAMRVLGPSGGITAMGLLGGLASSTVTTIAASRQSKDRPELSSRFALAIVLACTVMVARVGVLAGAIAPTLMERLIPILALMCVPALFYVGWSFSVSRTPRGHQPESPPIPNPLSLGIGIKFALIYAVVVLLSRAGADRYGASGVTVVSLLSGLTDMDAIALSLAQSAKANTINPQIATQGIILGAVSNTVLKAAFACSAGAPGLRLPILLVLGSTVAAAVAGLYWLN